MLVPYQGFWTADPETMPKPLLWLRAALLFVRMIWSFAAAFAVPVVLIAAVVGGLWSLWDHLIAIAR